MFHFWDAACEGSVPPAGPLAGRKRARSVGMRPNAGLPPTKRPCAAVPVSPPGTSPLSSHAAHDAVMDLADALLVSCHVSTLLGCSMGTL